MFLLLPEGEGRDEGEGISRRPSICETLLVHGKHARGQAPSAERSRGFTLIELMVVITLIGIVTAMILPEMRGTYEDALLRSSARKLVSVCNLASTRAITLNQPYRLTIDGKTGKFTVQHWARNSEEGSGFVPARDVVGGEDAIDPRIAVEVRKTGQPGNTEKDQPEETSAGGSDESDGSMRDGTLTFQPDGTADAAEIALRDRQGFVLVLRINPTTGRVRIIEPGSE